MKFFRITAFLIVIISVLVSVFYGFNIIGDNSVKEVVDYKGVLIFWQIDSFEGGIGSRRKFILNVSKNFEKKNQGVLVMAENHTEESAMENIKNGILPDLISFGVGVQISAFSEINSKTEFCGGEIGGKTYALPWARGGYVLIYNPKYLNEEEPSLIVSKCEYTLPLVSLALENLSFKDIVVEEPINAYNKFVSGQFHCLLGTQRDVFRLINRGVDFEIKPLSEFSDLYQYVSITSNNQLKRFYAEKFVNFLISQEVQNKLTEIGLFSPYFSCKYDNDKLNAMEKVKIKSTISAFTDKGKIKDINDMSFLAVKGDENSILKIKNIIV